MTTKTTATTKGIYAELLATATLRTKIDSVPLHRVHPGGAVHIQTALKGNTPDEAMDLIQTLFTIAAAELGCHPNDVFIGGDAREGTLFCNSRMETTEEMEKRIANEAELRAYHLQREKRENADRKKRIAKLEKELKALKNQSQSKQ